MLKEKYLKMSKVGCLVPFWGQNTKMFNFKHNVSTCQISNHSEISPVTFICKQLCYSVVTGKHSIFNVLIGGNNKHQALPRYKKW